MCLIINVLVRFFVSNNLAEMLNLKIERPKMEDFLKLTQISNFNLNFSILHMYHAQVVRALVHIGGVVFQT